MEYNINIKIYLSYLANYIFLFFIMIEYTKQTKELENGKIELAKTRNKYIQTTKTIQSGSKIERCDENGV